jgi:hypothetical protein
MTGPVKNFGTLDGITPLFEAPAPIVIPFIRLDAFTYLWRKTTTFFRFGLTHQTGIPPTVGVTSPRLSTLIIPNVASARLMLITFPPIYKTRTGRARPLKGQLWPRTR